MKSGRLVLKAGAITIAVGLMAGLLLIVLIYGASALLLRFLPGMTADCGWRGTAIAWLDANQNGAKDTGEVPLPDVKMHVADVQNHLADVAYHPITNGSGIANLDVWIPGCPKVALEIYADVPSGYKLTTPGRITVKRDFFGNIEYNKTYYFGFAKLP